MLIHLTVIQGCPFCDEVLKAWPKMVKKYPGVDFYATCLGKDTLPEVEDGKIFPIIGCVSAEPGQDPFIDEISGAIYEQQLTEFIERSLRKAGKES